MRTTTKLILVTIGLAMGTVVLLLGSAGAEAQDPMTIVSAPDWVYDSENISVTYRYDVTVYGKTPDDIDTTGIVWDTKWHGEFPAYGQFTNVTVATEGAKGTYFTSFEPPAGPATVHYHGYVEIDGTYYLSWEHLVSVNVTPKVRFGGMMGVSIAGHQHLTRWYIDNAAPEEIEETSVYWGMESHWGEPVDKANYPNRSEVFSGVLHSPFTTEITLPDVAGGVHMIYHALINGRDFYDPLQRSVSVIAVPEFNVTEAPAAALKGTSVDIGWSLPLTGGAYVNWTGVFFDTVSHAGSLDHTDYASSSDLLPGNDSREYGVTIPLPDQAGTVYFIVAVQVFDEWFYSEEMSIAVRDEPAVELDTSPGTAFEGSEVTITWTVTAAAEDVAGTAVLWDATSHAGTLDRSLYPNSSDVLAGEADGSYEAVIIMPAGAGVVYFILHAEVLGTDFYAPDEHSINVRVTPELEIVDAPTTAFAGSEVEIGFTVEGLMAEEDFTAAIHWDVASHSGDMVPASYAYHSGTYEGNTTGPHNISITLPDVSGVVYLIAHAVVMGQDFVTATEHSVQLIPLPAIVEVEGPTKVAAGDTIKVTFMLQDVDLDDLSGIRIAWGRESRPDASGYDSAVNVEPDPDGDYRVTFKAPKKKGTVYFRIVVDVDGESVHSPEGSVKVTEEKETPGPGAVGTICVLGLVAALATAMRRRR